jgi:hypothetical protein
MLTSTTNASVTQHDFPDTFQPTGSNFPATVKSSLVILHIAVIVPAVTKIITI